MRERLLLHSNESQTLAIADGGKSHDINRSHFRLSLKAPNSNDLLPPHCGQRQEAIDFSSNIDAKARSTIVNNRQSSHDVPPIQNVVVDRQADQSTD